MDNILIDKKILIEGFPILELYSLANNKVQGLPNGLLFLTSLHDGYNHINKLKDKRWNAGMLYYMLATFKLLFLKITNLS